VSWTFTEEGFINNGQSGNPRTYSDPATASGGSPWSFQGPLSLRMSFEDDSNCLSHNGNTQKGTATAVIFVSCPTTLYVNWSGMGEQQDTGFERMTFSLDGVQIASADSPGGGLGCVGMAPVLGTASSPQTLSPGLHQILIDTTTGDPWYHSGAFYQFHLSFDAVN
jgi:hypothetical protein